MRPIFKPQDYLPDLRRDIVFKAVFTKNTPASRAALTGLVSTFIDRKVTILSLIANEPPPEKTSDRQIRYDLACKFNNGELADIEMTLNPDTSENLRLEYYAARLFLSQNIRGENTGYAKLKYTYQISFIANRNLFSCPCYLHSFSYFDPHCGLSLGGKTRIITVELEKVPALAGKKSVGEMSRAERWAFFLRCASDKARRELVNEVVREEEAIGMAAEALLEVTREEIEWFRNESRLKYELDEQSRRADAWQAGLEEGFAKGSTEGLSEGLTKGAFQAKRETARRFKNMGFSVDQIAEGTGLSPREIQSL
jgi:predicted transposase/invertase (TIGR01784 family)